MRIGVIGENLREWLALALGRVPIPLAHSFFTFMLARVLIDATRLGVFDALAGRPLTAAELAARLGTHPGATEKLLAVLCTAGYLRVRGGRHEPTRMARRWMLDARGSMRDKVLFQHLEWEWWTSLENYLFTGDPLDIHLTLDDDEWRLYQRAMRAGNGHFAEEVARMLQLGAHPRSMIDVGGSHGYFSVALCRVHPALRSTVLDLPNAIQHAAPLLAAEGLGDRVVHRAGDALTTDLGTGHDLVLIANLVHHFSDAENRALMQRSAGALRPGGVVAVFETFRRSPGERHTQTGAMLDLYFGMTSRSGTWSAGEIASWQRDAGLTPRATQHLRSVRDLGIQAASRP